MDNKPEFVKLLLEYGVNYRTYMTKENLFKLYNYNSSLTIRSNEPFVMYLKSKKRRSSDNKKIEENTVIEHLKSILGYIKPTFFDDSRTGTLQEPELNLFFWAVLSNRLEIAKIFWRLGKVSANDSEVS